MSRNVRSAGWESRGSCVLIPDGTTYTFCESTGSLYHLAEKLYFCIYTCLQNTREARLATPFEMVVSVLYLILEWPHNLSFFL
jgi:hypothetical protein